MCESASMVSWVGTNSPVGQKQKQRSERSAEASGLGVGGKGQEVDPTGRSFDCLL